MSKLSNRSSRVKPAYVGGPKSSDWQGGLPCTHCETPNVESVKMINYSVSVSPHSLMVNPESRRLVISKAEVAELPAQQSQEKALRNEVVVLVNVESVAGEGSKHHSGIPIGRGSGGSLADIVVVQRFESPNLELFMINNDKQSEHHNDNLPHHICISRTAAGPVDLPTMNCECSIDTSVHSNLMTQLRSIPALTTSWLEESWSPISLRYERIATASPTMGMAVLTREMMEMHIVQTPNVRGMVDCLPVANRHGFIGWRQKLGTWPLSKHEARGGRQFEA
ncbi:hypothetical protein GLAREA_01882 [Glarea lozoyensis ATCC 20868]|uniref:Uncharacterized protein n=1 Tax=Glarea lozoyensis (strain ATCC 20868 / MF5171) TaxID=1116229 RepID=S3CJJ5_GLAL2|nr:uncharacterized protein GLAREA_01882 [Glarea lozoyensis ATCC 20868]EPE25970.1 hypothetical protein GLAREA_01882 [Glarea lozoyensis ATCC 20868]